VSRKYARTHIVFGHEHGLASGIADLAMATWLMGEPEPGGPGPQPEPLPVGPELEGEKISSFFWGPSTRH